MKKGRVVSMFLAGILTAGSLSQAVPAEEPTEVVITDLETNGLVNPLGIDTQSPVFDWKMVSDRIGAAQTSYQITVTAKDGTVMWDSGEVESSLSTEIPYQGKALEPRTTYTWKTAVKDENGVLWESEESTFETSLMDPSPTKRFCLERIQARPIPSLKAWKALRWKGTPS